MKMNLVMNKNKEDQMKANLMNQEDLRNYKNK